MRFRLTHAIAVPMMAFALLAVQARAYAAGTLCGTVHDAVSAAPVLGAGIFVFSTSGSYTGFHGASDAAGAFCIPGVPAGTYDLQVRRDHYLTAFVPGVTVVNDVTGVQVGVTPLRSELLPPSPNPAREHIRFRFRLHDPSAIRLEVVDAQGRLLKGWQGEGAAGENGLAWDFRTTAGRKVPAGRYFVRLTAAQSTITRSFIRLP